MSVTSSVQNRAYCLVIMNPHNVVSGFNLARQQDFEYRGKWIAVF